jgi:hypothetical protein
MITPIPGIGSHRFKHNSQVILSDCTSGRFERGDAKARLATLLELYPNTRAE